MSKAEDYIKKSTRRSQEGDRPYNEWVSVDCAKEAAEIAREEELEYTKYQLELKLPETLDYNGIQVDREDFINDFIKAVKDE